MSAIRLQIRRVIVVNNQFISLRTKILLKIQSAAANNQQNSRLTQNLSCIGTHLWVKWWHPKSLRLLAVCTVFICSPMPTATETVGLLLPRHWNFGVVTSCRQREARWAVVSSHWMFVWHEATQKVPSK